MKLALAILLVVVAAASAAPQRTKIQLTEEEKAAVAHLDSLDVETIIKDKSELVKHADCFLKEDDNDPCYQHPTPHSIRTLMEAFRKDECRSCSPQQRAKGIKIVKALKYDLPDKYKSLISKYHNGVEPPELEAL